MSCNHCINLTETNASNLTGVPSVKVDLKSREVTIDFDNDSITLDQIKETIEEQWLHILIFYRLSIYRLFL